MRLSEEQVKKIPELVNAGKPIIAVAAELGISIRMAYYWMRKLRVAGHVINTKRGRKPMKL